MSRESALVVVSLIVTTQYVMSTHGGWGFWYPQRLNQLQEPFRSRQDVPLEDELAVCAEDADIHRPGKEIDTTVERVLLSVELISLSCLGETLMSIT